MKEGFKIAGIGIASIVGLGLLSWGGLHWSGFLAKQREGIRYDIIKESQAHRDGMQRNLMQMQTDYLSADTAGKAAISAAVRHQYSQADTSEYPAHLQTFLRDMGI